jgi:hypothetical protein
MLSRLKKKRKMKIALEFLEEDAIYYRKKFFLPI